MTEAPIESISVSAWEIPTDEPESDSTLEWDSTTIVVVEVTSGDVTGVGWTYTGEAAATLIEDELAHLVKGRDALSPEAAWMAMLHELRNTGKPGIGAMSVSAVDMAVWDLKARLLGVSLSNLLGRQRDAVPLYGSGGFTSYDIGRLRSQLSQWVEAGMPWVKMKIGRHPEADEERVAQARKAIGDEAGLFVDANGAYDPKQAMEMARSLRCLGVTWFEEPVSSDDMEGLRLVRQAAPAGMEVAAGEYVYRVYDALGLIDHGAVDVIQADITRCGGITAFLAIADLAYFRHVPFSSHTAPQAHLHPATAVKSIRHMEWFHDHVRIESQLFEGAPQPDDGSLAPDPAVAGTGLSVRHGALSEYRVA